VLLNNLEQELFGPTPYPVTYASLSSTCQAVTHLYSRSKDPALLVPVLTGKIGFYVILAAAKLVRSFFLTYEHCCRHEQKRGGGLFAPAGGDSQGHRGYYQVG
jgi:hypothetical protein